MSKRLFYFLFLGNFFLSTAQSISLDFPHFAGKAFDFWVFQGSQKDTLAKGILDAQGKAVIALPKASLNYAGMAQWMLREGGGLDLVINREHFSVESQEALPSEENILYKGSPENNFLIKQHHRQQALFAKIDAMRLASSAYAGDSLAALFQKELTTQEKEFENIMHEWMQSPLYAAKFRLISNLLLGIGPVLGLPEDQNAKSIHDFIVKDLDFEALFSSNLWDSLIAMWADMQENILKNDNLWLHDMQFILSRIKSPTVYTALADNIVTLWLKQGKDDITEELGAWLKKQNRLVHPSKMLQKITVAQSGDRATPLSGLKKNTLLGKTTLLFFYQSGCGHCENQIDKLLELFPALHKKGIQIISIAADTELDIYKPRAHAFPWELKLCDFKGFDGPNFNAYGIMGTPTYIIVDKKGIISGRFATIQDTALLP